MAGLAPPRPLEEKDDRDQFDCGRDSLNLWLRRHAWRNQLGGTSRTSIVTSNGAIAGFVSLSAGQIERDYLPKPARRNAPNPIPVILLGQLAVDRAHQGKGIARSLLRFALTTSLRLSAEIGCFGVITHPIDDEIRGFYRNFGFQDLPGDPGGSMIVRMAELRQNGF